MWRLLLGDLQTLLGRGAGHSAWGGPGGTGGGDQVDPEVPEPFPYCGTSSWRHHSTPGHPSYLLLLEVQELHRAHLSVGLPAGGSFSPPAAPAAIGLVGEAADPVLAGGSGAYRLRGGFNHHDLLAGPEERGGRKVEAEKRGRAPRRHPHFQTQCLLRGRATPSFS